MSWPDVAALAILALTGIAALYAPAYGPRRPHYPTPLTWTHTTTKEK